MPAEQLIFTNRPLGKGLDPERDGFQVVACSPGVGGDVRNQLSTVCMAFGTAFHERAPRAAKNEHGDVLEEFPTIWRYVQLAKELYALVRAQYLGLIHDGRPGNYIAHAIIFSPELLAPYDHNPLSLSQSGLFKSTDDGQTTVLRSLPDLGRRSAPSQCYLLTQDEYREQAGPMVAAISAVTAQSKTAVLCLKDWRYAAPLVEALLYLLPPSVRVRTTFNTYHTDSIRGAATEISRFNIVVAVEDNVRLLGLTEQDYAPGSECPVFEFIEGRFTEFARTRPYADCAGQLAAKGQADLLKPCYELIEGLRMVDDRSLWDVLVQIVDGSTMPEKEAVQAWQEAGAKITPIFQEALDPEKQQLLELVVKCVPAEAYPKDAAGLSLRLLEASRPAGQELSKLLADIARFLALCGDDKKFAWDVLARIKAVVTDVVMQAVGLGWMAHKAANSQIGQYIFAAYQQSVQSAWGAKDAIRTRLAKANATGSLCTEMLADVLPWDPEFGPVVFDSWKDAVLQHSLPVLDAVCANTATRLTGSQEPSDILPLATRLLNMRPAGNDIATGMLALCNAYVQALPLHVLNTETNIIQSFPSDNLTPTARSRWTILDFMTKTTVSAQKADWSLAQFEHAEPAWRQEVGMLPDDQRRAVVQWYYSLVKMAGITSPQDAQSLCQSLTSVGETPDGIASALWLLLQNRDRVTAIQVAMAFAQSASASAGGQHPHADIFVALVNQFGGGTRALLEEHLRGRFCTVAQANDPSMVNLFATVGIKLPRAAQPSETSERNTLRGFLNRLFRRGPRKEAGD